MSQKIVVVDAFTDQPFTGNPAAVCVLDEVISDERMQLIAREMNHAETAFVRSTGDAFSLRWFTPTTEVDLCGHATLAAAHALWESEKVTRAHVIGFDTRSGCLSASWREGWIELDFPTTPVAPLAAPAGLAEAIGCEVVSVSRSKFDLLVELPKAAAVRNASPDLTKLKHFEVRGIIITAAGDAGADFVSRFFAPRSGLDEDPVTGSAHCALGEYWQRKLGRSEFVARQVSERGGIVKLRVKCDRTLLLGQAITTLRGELLT